MNCPHCKKVVVVCDECQTVYGNLDCLLEGTCNDCAPFCSECRNDHNDCICNEIDVDFNEDDLEVEDDLDSEEDNAS